jgi:hypothetical protein
MFESIDQGRFAEVAPDLTALIGRMPESFEEVLRRGSAE